MNLPNKLTSARFVMTAIFLVALYTDFKFHETVALLFFGFAGITDHLDGRFARKYNLITNFGKLMDPLADKIMTCSAFIAFVGLHKMAAWMVVVIVAREFAITGLRTLAASKNIILAAEGFGKHKTVSQIVCILAILVCMSYPEWGAFGKVFAWPIGGLPWADQFAHLMQWVSVILTLVSGALYLWRNRSAFLTET
ncbi:MAG: CDP-diacylglycerol--glycerol-3-phosphate 3-phosphatidyltransferase [Desulfobacterales bacterium]|nr:CDP-diacylglycerol--glycerol-3-phosphate 3-phosphatidyltransferase [Desulfobacterales bacterium]